MSPVTVMSRRPTISPPNPPNSFTSYAQFYHLNLFHVCITNKHQNTLQEQCFFTSKNSIEKEKCKNSNILYSLIIDFSNALETDFLI